MTIAVSLKVADGLVLAADSAATVMNANGVENVYNNANKVFNLRKGHPVGLITWGLGGLSGCSISTLAKDLRIRFTRDDGDHRDWHLDGENYTVEAVAEKVREFFYDEHYKPALDAYEPPDDEAGYPTLGLIVAGYSAGSQFGETFLLEFTAEGCRGPERLEDPELPGLYAGGDPEIVWRVVNGYSPDLLDVLVDFGLDENDVPGAAEYINERLHLPLINAAMPFQDAIDLAEWLVALAIGYSRFRPGAPTVGGPIETAAISKHEGFKWVKRKHYFDARFNPEGLPR